MKAMKLAALAAAMMFATGNALALDTQLDQLVHNMEDEVDHLLEEIHHHHLGSHLDTDAHEVQEALATFHEHVAHGDSAHQLWSLLSPLGHAVVHMQQTARSMGHHGPWGWVWYSDVNPHVQRELNHVVNSYNRIYNHLYWQVHHHHHHPHWPHH